MRESNYVTKEDKVNTKEGRSRGKDRQPKHRKQCGKAKFPSQQLCYVKASNSPYKRD